MRELIRWLEARKFSHCTNVQLFDECLYTTYTYQHVDEARGLPSTSPWGLQRGKHFEPSETHSTPTGDLLGVPELQTDSHSVFVLCEVSTDFEVTVVYKRSEKKAKMIPVTSQVFRKAVLVSQRLLFNMYPKCYSWSTEVSAYLACGKTNNVAVVIWGMSQTEEKRLLREIRKFEIERLALEDIESEELHWYLADYSRYVCKYNLIAAFTMM